MRFISVCCYSALALLALASAAGAVAPPKRINFQGKLLDKTTNEPRNGTVAVTFSLYDVPSGGSALYSETQNLAVNNGVFSAQIGAAGDLSADLFARTTIYLGITVAPDAEMTPRSQLVMSPYAYVAASLMRNKDIAVNAGTTYSTFTVDGNLLVDYGVSADTASLASYLEFGGASAPGAATGLARLYYDSTTDDYRLSANGRSFTPLGTKVFTLWNTNATAGTANQGLNLPAALTELNSAVQGTRMLIDCDDLPAQLALRYNIRGLTAANLTLTLSVRDATNTANVLVSVSQAVSAANATYVSQGAFASKPAWCSGRQTIAIYTQGGNGSADYIFNHIVLVGKP